MLYRRHLGVAFNGGSNNSDKFVFYAKQLSEIWNLKIKFSPPLIEKVSSPFNILKLIINFVALEIFKIIRKMNKL